MPTHLKIQAVEDLTDEQDRTENIFKFGHIRRTLISLFHYVLQKLRITKSMYIISKRLKQSKTMNTRTISGMLLCCKKKANQV